MAKLDNQRVDKIYEKLTGHPPRRGSWTIERRNFAQKIVYIDGACRAASHYHVHVVRLFSLLSRHGVVKA
jgi:hypothetical protein